MNENKEQNDKIAGRIEDRSGRLHQTDPVPVNPEGIKNILQFTRTRPPHWGGSIRELIDKTIELFEKGPEPH